MELKFRHLMYRCKEKGISISRWQLYRDGRKYGFIEDEDGKLSFDLKKFKEWLKHKTEPIPEGWYTVKELSEKKGVSVGSVCYVIKRGNLKKKDFRWNGVSYVRLEEFERFVEKNKRGGEE